MTSTEILDRLDELGVSILLDDGTVQLEPGRLVPPSLVAEIRQHKSELISALSLPDIVYSDVGQLTRLRSGHLWLIHHHSRWYQTTLLLRGTVSLLECGMAGGSWTSSSVLTMDLRAASTARTDTAPTGSHALDAARDPHLTWWRSWPCSKAGRSVISTCWGR